MSQVRYEVQDAVATIALAAPPINTLNLERLEAVLDGFRRAAADEAVRAVILASDVPGFFSAGLDIEILRDQSGRMVRSLLDHLYTEMTDIPHHLGKPSIAAVGGAARGGGMTLAVSCNVILAGRGATFGYPEVNIGVPPAIHLSHLPRIVGRHRAFELLFSGRAFGPEEAERLGLVSRVVEDVALMDEARTLARTFAEKSPTVMRQGHAAFMTANDVGYRGDVAAAVETFCSIAGGDDAREALAAFLEKRPPAFD